jgi:hypothetical protein
MSTEIIPFSISQPAAKEIIPPALFSRDAGTARRVLEFFTVNIRNPHTRKAYGIACDQRSVRFDRAARASYRP